MSWKFAGIIFRKDYSRDHTRLLEKLGVTYYQSAEGFTFASAIGRDNQAAALGTIGEHTFFLHHFLSYDCSYQQGEEGRLDEILADLSTEADIFNYIIDGLSETYCFSAFSGGKRIRRRGADPGNIWCDEGELLPGETAIKRMDQIDETAGLPSLFHITGNEAQLIGAWEAFSGCSFQEMLADEQPFLSFYL
jgi:hypothetical protein